MRAILQRVTSAAVEVDDKVIGCIDDGLVVFLGVGKTDGEHEALVLADKVANLRIFADDQGRTNLSLLDTGGGVLVISQFTLYADCRRGRRPSFSDAADPEPAADLVETFRLALERMGITTQSGQFGAHMIVSLVNDGPFTINLDTEALSAPRSGKSSPSGG